MSSLTRDIVSFLLNDQMLPLKYLILGQLQFDQIAEDLGLNRAKYKNFSEAMQYIKDEHVDIKLSFAATFNLLDEAKLLISRSPNAMWIGLSAQIAAEKGHLAMVEYLISQGASNYGNYAQVAALNGQLHVVQFLTTMGFNKKDVMKAAARGGHLDIIKFVNRTCELESYNCILSIGAKHGHENIVNFALAKGANDLLAYLLSFKMADRNNCAKIMARGFTRKLPEVRKVAHQKGLI